MKVPGPMTPAGAEEAVTLSDVLITQELERRPARGPDFQAENAALHSLAQHLADQPEALLGTLAHLAVDLCCPTGTAGVSLLETSVEGHEVFKWVAVAGQLASYTGGTTPRDFSPCGTCLDYNSPQLFAYPERLFPYFRSARPVICEGLVLPFSVDGVPSGTIWVVSHDERKRFDGEDVRLMSRLADFTAAAYRIGVETAYRRRAEDALRLADTQKDQFIATIAHELRQPVSAMLPALAIMHGGADIKTGEAARHVLERQVAQLQRILDDLLDLSRFAGGKVTLRKEPLDLRQLVEQATSAMRPLFANGSQHLEVDLPLAPVSILGDPVRLQQVLSNLLTNAARHTPPGGQVSVHVHVGEDHVQLRVCDNGRGITSEALQRIFDPFVQVAGEEVGRLGLGLTVVRELVKLHGATIEAQSDGIGHGSEFRVTLPL